MNIPQKLVSASAAAALCATPLQGQETTIEQAEATWCLNAEPKVFCELFSEALGAKALRLEGGNNQQADARLLGSDPIWGVLRDLVGVPFVDPRGEVHIYRWEVPDKILVHDQFTTYYYHSMRAIYYDEKKNRLRGWYGNGPNIPTDAKSYKLFDAVRLSDGSVVLGQEPQPGHVRLTFRNDGTLAKEVGHFGRVFDPSGSSVLSLPISQPTLDRVLVRFAEGKAQNAVIAEYMRREAVARLARERAANATKGGGGGLFRTLLGVAVGGYAAAAGRFNAQETLTAIAQSAAVTSGNSGIGAAVAAGIAKVQDDNARMQRQMQSALVTPPPVASSRHTAGSRL